jgi:peptidoglycan/xylan/chitin deacetylase (PgdA/CDA1 family)
MWILIIIVSLFLIYASADIRSGVYVKTISRIKTQEKQLAITFDDGPHAEITPQILDILKKYNIKATFFCKGKNIENQPDLVRRIISEGHGIGNHTMRHSAWFPFYPAVKMKKEIDDCQALIDAFQPAGAAHLFRPPFGVTNPNLRKALKGSDYSVIGWNIRSLDTTKISSEILFKRIIRQIKSGSIILFHDTKPETPNILERVINFAHKKGFNFAIINVI